VNDQQIREDMAQLMGLPAFRRFLWRAIQSAGIFSATANGSDDRHLIAEGRRQLGLLLLTDAEMGQPVTHPAGIPILTAIQVLREEAQAATKPEKAKRHDRTAELDMDDPTD